MELCDDDLRCCVREMERTLAHELPVYHNGEYNKFVSDHTYRRYFTKGMAKVLSLDNAINGIARYAALSVDDDKSTFSFSPLAARIHGPENPVRPQRVTFGYINTFVKGKVTSDGFAELAKGGKWNKEFTAGFSLVVWYGSGGGDWYMTASEDQCKQTKLQNFRRVQQALPTEICRKYQGKIDDIVNGDVSAYVESSEDLEDCDGVQTAMRKEYSDIEEKLAEPFWKGKWRWWVSLTPEYGYKGLAVLDTGKQAGAEEKSLPTGSVKLSGNLLVQRENWPGKPSFYFSLAAALTQRNMFSDMSTQSWNKYVQQKDTSFLITDSKDVYWYDGRDIDQKLLPTFSGQLVGIWNWKKFGIGYDISLSYDMLYSMPGIDNSKITESYGLVFPFNDKEGERTINLTLFYQHSTFSLSTVDAIELVGVRFAVPIFSAEEK